MKDKVPSGPQAARVQAQAPFMFGGLLIGLLALVFALPSFIIVAAGMIPTILAYVLPTAPDDKRRALAIAMLNFAGVLPVLAMLWSRGHSLDHAMQLLGEPLPWLLMLGGAAIAAMLHTVLPNAAISVMERAAEQRVGKLNACQRELVSEWGAAVKGEMVPEEPPAEPGSGQKKGRPQ